MKTAEQILEYHTGHAYGLMGLSQINAMKEYAKQVAAQALKDAYENAKITYLTIQNNEGKPDVIQPIVNKESITKTEIETP